MGVLKTATAGVFAAAITATSALAQDDSAPETHAETHLAATIKFPEFVCWQPNAAGDNMALFTAPLYTAEQGGYYEDITPEGLFAYPEYHIDENGDPLLYELKEGSYLNLFEGEAARTLEETIEGLSDFDQRAIRETIKANENRDQNGCPSAPEPVLLG